MLCGPSLLTDTGTGNSTPAMDQTSTTGTGTGEAQIYLVVAPNASATGPEIPAAPLELPAAHTACICKALFTLDSSQRLRKPTVSFSCPL